MKFQNLVLVGIKEVLDKVKEEFCINLKKYFESLSSINIESFNQPLEEFKNDILRNLTINCLVAGNNSDSGSSKSISLYHIINDTAVFIKLQLIQLCIFHGIPFGVSLSIYSGANFGGLSKTLFVPFEINKVYSDILTSSFNGEQIINMPTNSDYDTPINYEPIDDVGNVIHFDGLLARNAPQNINEDNTTAADGIN